MKSVFNFIVEPANSRSTSVKELDGKELLLNTELQNHEYTSRLAVVKALPMAEATEIKVGDQVLVHHNVFRRFRDVRGNEKNSKSYYSEDTFFVQPDQVYAYKREGKWYCLSGFCFVKPIVNKNKFSLSKEQETVGIIKYADKGFSVGELVGFLPYSEYEFNIEGERLYRIPSRRITIKYEYQGDEEEYNSGGSQGS